MSFDDRLNDDGSADRLPALDEASLPLSGLVRNAVRFSLLALTLFFLIAAFVVAQSSIQLAVRTTGQLEPDSLHWIRSRVTGVVIAVNTASGDHVRKGQALFQLDSIRSSERAADLSARIEILRDEIDRLRLSDSIDILNNQTRRELVRLRRVRAMAELRGLLTERGESLSADSLVSYFVAGTDVALDLAVAEVMSAERELQLLETDKLKSSLSALQVSERRRERQLLEEQLEAAYFQVDAATIVAPVDGVVLADRLDALRGSSVAVGDPLVEIGNSSRWVVRSYVSSDEISEIGIGAQAVVRLPSSRATYIRPIDAKVSSIAFRPSQSGGNSVGSQRVAARSFEVVLSLDSLQLAQLGPRVRYGLPAEVNISKRSARALTLLREWFASVTPSRL